MIRKALMVIFTACSLFSCKTKEPNNTEPTNTVKIPENNNGIDVGCYVFNDGKTFINLELKENGAVVKGNLTYALAEKDKNTGSFSGVVKADILLANYNFQSEGVQSMRTVAFKINGHKLTEGYGDMTADGTRFAHPDSLSFSSNMTLEKGACEIK